MQTVPTQVCIYFYNVDLMFDKFNLLHICIDILHIQRVWNPIPTSIWNSEIRTNFHRLFE